MILSRKRRLAEISGALDKHRDQLGQAADHRRSAVQVTSVANDTSLARAVSVTDTFGIRQPSDKWQGCCNLRTLRALLSLVDERGFERSEHQLQFHSSFERCVSRVIYKGDWSSDRPAIMAHNKWERCSSEVMISTPRRFGKVGRSADCAPHTTPIPPIPPPLPPSFFADARVLKKCPLARWQKTDVLNRHLLRGAGTEFRLRDRRL